ncbi:uncharacterized protein [Coffea arabica]|uniref:Endonuclease/exonuclease/phosphatase domain-containing protein n=1 Tax=Coffea arabica TaxID=13443 RepID=A0ABM4WMK2_COFAR
MTERGQVEAICHFLHFTKAEVVLGGKFWLFWCDDLVLHFHEFGDQLVHMEVGWSGFTFHFSAVYVKYTRVRRRHLWEAMEVVSAKCQGPWMVAGDLNIISNVNERSGGAPPNPRNMEDFNEAVFNCGLSDVGFEGSQFTWTNSVEWQHLDRALNNGAWNELFQCSKVFHLSRGHLDHAPLMIRCGDIKATASSFRFFNVWRNHPDFLAIVQETW